MADGVQITQGSGTTILTDDTGAGGHAQVVKLAISTDGSATLVPADSSNGLDVDVTRVSGDVTVVQPTASNLNANVSGTVTANAGTGSFTVAQATAANLNATVTGTVTANAGTGNFTVAQATASNLNAQVVGAGASGSAVSGNPVLNAGSDGTNARTLKTDTAGVQLMAGDIANDAIDSGNPVKIGGFAEAAISTATMVADADRVNFVGDIDGLQVIKPYTTYGDILVERLSNTDGASTASTVFGATAGARNMITTISVYNASTTNAYVDIRDGTAGTILFTIPCPANGGAITNFPVPLRQTTANTALAFDASAALTTLYISFIGFKSKV